MGFFKDLADAWAQAGEETPNRDTRSTTTRPTTSAPPARVHVSSGDLRKVKEELESKEESVMWLFSNTYGSDSQFQARWLRWWASESDPLSFVKEEGKRTEELPTSGLPIQMMNLIVAFYRYEGRDDGRLIKADAAIGWPAFRKYLRTWADRVELN